MWHCVTAHLAVIALEHYRECPIYLDEKIIQELRIRAVLHF
jgi:hypothetical protein